MNTKKKIDWSEYLEPNEKLENVPALTLRQRRHRAQQRLVQPLNYTEAYEEFPREQKEELHKYVIKITKQVQGEMSPDASIPAAVLEITVHKVAWCLFSFKKGWTRSVFDPRGELVGGIYFADVIGTGIVADTHRYGLERSSTFAVLYQELLRNLDQRYGKNLSEDPTERRAALDIKAELAGEYVFDRSVKELQHEDKNDVRGETAGAPIPVGPGETKTGDQDHCGT